MRFSTIFKRQSSLYSTLPTESHAKLSAFISRSGLDFIPQPILIHALTHKSSQLYTPKTTEKLQLQGKSALNHYVTEYILTKYPDLPAGASQSIIKSLTSTQTLSNIGSQLGVPFVMSWKKNNQNLGEALVTSSIMQSLIGAIYQQKGPSVTKKFILAHVLSRSIDIQAHVEMYLKMKQPKTLLAHILKSQNKVPPASRLLKESGRLSVSPIFIVGVYSGIEKIGEGYGSSLNMAETRAVVDALLKHYTVEIRDINLPSDMDHEESLTFLENQDIDFKKTYLNLDFIMLPIKIQKSHKPTADKRTLFQAFEQVENNEHNILKKSKVVLLDEFSQSHKLPNPTPEIQNSAFSIPLISKNTWVNNNITESQKNTVIGFKMTETVAPNLSDKSKNYGLQISKQSSNQNNYDTEMDLDYKPSADIAPSKSIEEQAIDALISESKQLYSSDPSLNSHINNNALPILVQNAVPGIENFRNETDKFKHDVSLRPAQADLDDYERIPIEAFGSALLRGMGWKEGTNVGKNQNGLSNTIVQNPRPHLLGLGAQEAPPMPSKHKQYIKPGEKRAPDVFKAPAPKPVIEAPRNQSPESTPKKLELKIGDLVKIMRGRNKGRVGNILEIKEKTDGLAAKIQIINSSEIVRVWLDELEISRKESSDCNQPMSNSMAIKGWLRPRIKVRFISKSFMNGRYYNEKCIIQDVITRGECIVKTLRGEVIDGILEKYLETYIPSAGGHLMVVSHKDRSLIGTSGKLVERNNEKQTVMVQMDHSYEFLTFHFDEVSEVADYD